MKKLIIISITAFGFIVTAFAVPLCVEVPSNDVPRVQEAFGSILNLGRPANLAEVQAATRQWLIGQTQDYERRKNMATFTPPPLDMQPTPSPSPTPMGLQSGATLGTATVTSPTPTPTPKKKKK